MGMASNQRKEKRKKQATKMKKFDAQEHAFYTGMNAQIVSPIASSKSVKKSKHKTRASTPTIIADNELYHSARSQRQQRHKQHKSFANRQDLEPYAAATNEQQLGKQIVVVSEFEHRKQSKNKIKIYQNEFNNQQLHVQFGRNSGASDLSQHRTQSNDSMMSATNKSIMTMISASNEYLIDNDEQIRHSNVDMDDDTSLSKDSY